MLGPTADRERVAAIESFAALDEDTLARQCDAVSRHVRISLIVLWFCILKGAVLDGDVSGLTADEDSCAVEMNPGKVASPAVFGVEEL